MLIEHDGRYPKDKGLIQPDPVRTRAWLKARLLAYLDRQYQREVGVEGVGGLVDREPIELHALVDALL